MSHLYPRPKLSGSRPIAQTGHWPPTKKMTALMEGQQGVMGLGRNTWHRGPGEPAPPNRKRCWVSATSPDVAVWLVWEKERTGAGVWVSAGAAAAAFSPPGGFYPVSYLREIRERKEVFGGGPWTRCFAPVPNYCALATNWLCCHSFPPAGKTIFHFHVIATFH